MVKTRLLALAVVAGTGVLGILVATSFVSCGETRPDDQSGLAATPGEEREHSIGRPEGGTPIYISLVGDAWRAIFGEENWQKNIVDDDKKVGVTDSVMFQESVAEFQDFPLYWVGLEFQGLPLTGIIRSYGTHLTPPEDHVILKYGTCTPSPGAGCGVPLQIRVEPYCNAQRGGGYAPEATEDTVFQVRGASAQYISGGLRLWMGDVTVRVSAGPEEEELNVAEALVAANGMGPATPDQQFPPLNSDCSDFTQEP